MNNKQKPVKTAAALLAAAAMAGVLSGCGKGPVFQDTTVELGQAILSPELFLQEGSAKNAGDFALDASGVDPNNVGTYPVTLSNGKDSYTVNLNIQDTTAPYVVFTQQTVARAGEALNPEYFVEAVDDLSSTTVAFAQEPVIPQDYSPIVVEVVVTDASGNQTRGLCDVEFTWMEENLTWEYGTPITKKDLLFDHKKDEALINQADLDEINAGGPGEYTITAGSGSTAVTCTIHVRDTKGPDLKLQYVHIWPQEYVTLEDFIASVEDPSGIADIQMLSELDTLTKGERPIVIKAVDTLGNETVAETFIKVNLDHNAPVISGIEDLNVVRGEAVDYMAGITAKDNVDGDVEVAYDDSKVDLETAGVYFVTYTSQDSAGNVTSVRRRVVVPPEDADIQALVDEVAAQLSDDPKEIRDFVWHKIRYSASWGEPHPTWHGFTNWSGNCYVHAYCLQALLEAKGYETQLIWTTEKSHYWVLVNLESMGMGWRHMDATPSEQHVRILYMNDWQRYENLDGRNWDRTQWPKAE